MSRVGVVGLGAMGLGMAKSLRRAGFADAGLDDGLDYAAG